MNLLNRAQSPVARSLDAAASAVRVSWSLPGVGVGGLLAGALLRPRDCCCDGIGSLIVLPLAAALTAAATRSGAVHTHRLR